MKIPNADKAVIAPEKLRDYLLNVAHRKGATKARLLLSFGYSPDNWQRLEADIRTYHLAAHVFEEAANEYGTCYVIVAPISTPQGRDVVFRSVWQIDTGADYPRLITMYPE